MYNNTLYPWIPIRRVWWNMCYVSDHFVKNEIESLNFDVRCIKLYKLYQLVYTFLIRLLVGRALIEVQKLQGLFESKRFTFCVPNTKSW